MSNFSYRGGEYYAEGVSFSRIAEETGTPVYVYSRSSLEQQYRAYDSALGGVPHIICYAMKANANLAILALFARLGSGFDIVTGGELYRSQRAGGDPAKTVFSGVGKSDAEIAQALDAGILMFNVESADELAAINRVAGEKNVKAPIALRVNPDVDPQTHPYISTGMKTSKFGINLTQARDVYRDALAMPNINIIGVDCHIGSQLTKLEPFRDSLARVVPLIDELREAGADIRYFDFGGGLGIRYNEERPPEIADYGKTLAEAVRGRGVTLIVEPGRNLVGNAGVLLSRVLYNKQGEAKHFVIVDAAMNDLIRPSLYDGYHEIVPVRQSQGNSAPVDIVGPVCESGDFLARDRELRPLAVGDLIAVMSAGGYGFAMSSNYNSRPRAAEVLVDCDGYDVVRRRESFDDLVRGEIIPPSLADKPVQG